MKFEIDYRPSFTLNLKIAWKKLILFVILESPLWIFLLVIWKINLDMDNPNIAPFYENLVLGTNLVFGLFLGIPLIIGLIKKNSFIIFKVDIARNQLEYDLYYSNIRVSRKTYSLQEINRFEVVLRMKTKYKNLYQSNTLALTFQSEKPPKYLTKPAQEKEVIDLAIQLNQFLENNTNLDRVNLNREIIPYLPKKEQMIQAGLIIFACVAMIFALITVIIVIVLMGTSSAPFNF